jgi:2-amino-4-hydroxy-6-hydroxymethyldihydropteridine diphosphokinase
MRDRAFVLLPLAEIESDWRHPVTEEAIMDLIKTLPEKDVRAVVPIL